MKKKRVLIGCLGALVVLSGTTGFYFVGVDRADVAPAMAVPPDGGCPAGGFCAKPVTGLGCAYIPCCPQGQQLCGTDKHIGSESFQKLKNDGLGSCWSYSGDEELWCTKTVCQGDQCRGFQACNATGPVEYLYRTPPANTGPKCVMAL
jgi:hypothetical protein